MKIQLETITRHTDNSFSMMFDPRLSDLFYWHFHPEYELVYIKSATGTRHVGDHIATFKGSDLVLIGSNIPHLNFDYGLKTTYRKVVAHLKKDFIEKHIRSTPELSDIPRLFERSKYGIAFNGKIKNQIGERLLLFEQLDAFQQYLELLSIFRSLSESNDYELLHASPYTKKYSEREQGRVRTLYAFVDKHYQRQIALEEVAALSNMTKEAFCRYFKKASGNTFIDFLNRYRISHSKRLLMSGKNVSDACYNCGFGSLSYFNRVFKKITDENPSDFRKRYL